MVTKKRNGVVPHLRGRKDGKKMNRIDKALSIPLSWDWNDLQRLNPAPSDLEYVSAHVPRGSAAWKMYKKHVDAEMDALDCPRGIYYKTLIWVLSVAIGAFPD